ncbi:hypothetical protein [Sphingosinicella sp. BN140058]|uniref:hypothetical protein n=1 Tax=Sphingosinicella sp. BN140058 TaxID=1892855 RepID=UPI0010130848|nr:hypothetical protein [Sphingosinicella sp. BN140058]QAY80456.1 hypothetical protein ETR14_27855 [Sphingosinicella sp. BN140058]
MNSDTVLSALEEAAQLIARLDARISATSLVEPWQVRASLLAAERLAAVDGMPTRVADIVGLMLGVDLPSPAAYRPATIGFAHWRRCMARIALSHVGSRLLGRTPSPSRAAREAQSDFDVEDTYSPAARRVIEKKGTVAETVDAYAVGVSNRALDVMRGFEHTGSTYWGLARAMRAAVTADPDPEYFERIYKVRLSFENDARARARLAEKLFPSPPPPEVRESDEHMEDFIRSVVWDKQPHLGACFAVLPDRLVDMGVTVNRLSCLTGAVKRLGFERRLDERAFVGFLRQLAWDARAGLALLDSLERALGEFGRSPATKVDGRSPLPDVIYGFLLLPALDVGWIEDALQIPERNAQRAVKRLADAGLIVHWADRKIGHGESSGQRTLRLWATSSFAGEFDRSVRSRSSSFRRGKAMVVDPSEMLARYRDLDVSIPMSVVYDRFDAEVIGLDRQYGRFFAKVADRAR